MLLFNFKLKYNGEWVYYFNTSNVTIQPLMSNIQGMTLIFQYI